MSPTSSSETRGTSNRRPFGLAPVYRIKPVPILLLTLAVPCVKARAAQVTVGADAALSTRYVWRGLTRTSDPVIQPSLYLALQRGPSFLTAGLWFSFEPFEGDASDLSDTGLDRRGVGELNYWAEYSRSAGPADLALGWTGYRFRREPGARGRSSTFNSSEIYGRLLLRPVPALQLRTGVWYDVDSVDGAYIESGVDLRIPLLPLRTRPVSMLHLGILSAWSVGQEVNDADSLEIAHFADPGLAYLELAIWSSFYVAPSWSLAPALHFQISRDALTKRTGAGPGAVSDSKLWLTIHVSWRRSLAGDQRDAR